MPSSFRSVPIRCFALRFISVRFVSFRFVARFVARLVSFHCVLLPFVPFRFVFVSLRLVS